MESNKSKSVKNLLYSVSGQLITIAIGLIIPRLVLISFGSEINGLINSVNQYIVYLCLFEAGIGTVTLQALYKPIVLNDKESINGILAATNGYYKKTGLYYLIALLLLSFVYPLIVKSEVDYLTIFLVVFLSGISNVVLYYFQGKYKLLLQADGKNYIVANLTTITNVLIGVFKVILINFGFSIVAVLVSSFIINTLQAIYIMSYIKRNYAWIDLNVQPNDTSISQKNFTLVHQIAGLIFQNTDVLILTMVCGLKVVSVYSMYKLVITYLESILNHVVISFNFILGQTFQVDIEKYKERIDVFESFYSAICFAIYSVTLYLIIPFIKLYTNGVNDINYVDNLIAILFVTIAILTVMRTPMLYVIQHAGHFKETLPQTIVETLLNLIVSIIASFKFGIYGVLIGTIIALLYRTIDAIHYSNRKLLNRSSLKTYMIHFFNLIAFVGTQILFKLLFNYEVNSYINFISTGCFAFIISLTLFVGIQIIVFPNNIKTIKQFLRK